MKKTKKPLEVWATFTEQGVLVLVFPTSLFSKRDMEERLWTGETLHKMQLVKIEKGKK